MLEFLRFLGFLLFQNETNTVHRQFARADGLSDQVIGAGIEEYRPDYGVRTVGSLKEAHGLTCLV
jgi:hypothetical protein